MSGVSHEPLLPPVDAVSERFWEGARLGELRVQQCADSGRLIFPPRLLSPWGRRGQPGWTRVSGLGTIWSFVVPHPPLLPQFAEVAPYNVIVVALDEDPTIRMVGNLVTAAGDPLDAVDPESIEIGAPVRVVFEPVSDTIHMPRWVLA